MAKVCESKCRYRICEKKLNTTILIPEQQTDNDIGIANNHETQTSVANSRNCFKKAAKAMISFSRREQGRYESSKVSALITALNRI